MVSYVLVIVASLTVNVARKSVHDLRIASLPLNSPSGKYATAVRRVERREGLDVLSLDRLDKGLIDRLGSVLRRRRRHRRCEQRDPETPC
jgi:hypothetical protein